MTGNKDIDLNDAALLKKGRRLTRQGDYARAVQVFSLAIDQNREFAEAYFSRGACYYMLGYYRRAADDLNAASLLAAGTHNYGANSKPINSTMRMTKRMTKTKASFLGKKPINWGFLPKLN